MQKVRKIIRNILVSKSDPILGQRFETEKVEEIICNTASPLPSPRMNGPTTRSSKKNQQSLNNRSCNREGRK